MSAYLQQWGLKQGIPSSFLGSESCPPDSGELSHSWQLFFILRELLYSGDMFNSHLA